MQVTRKLNWYSLNKFIKTLESYKKVVWNALKSNYFSYFYLIASLTLLY